VKTDNSRKSLTIASELLERLEGRKQATQFCAAEDGMFASPIKLGRLPYSYTGVWRELQHAAEVSGIGRLGTHSFRHTPARIRTIRNRPFSFLCLNYWPTLDQGMPIIFIFVGQGAGAPRRPRAALAVTNSSLAGKQIVPLSGNMLSNGSDRTRPRSWNVR
jgi:hypothetical protein